MKKQAVIPMKGYIELADAIYDSLDRIQRLLIHPDLSRGVKDEAWKIYSHFDDLRNEMERQYLKDYPDLTTPLIFFSVRLRAERQRARGTLADLGEQS